MPKRRVSRGAVWKAAAYMYLLPVRHCICHPNGRQSASISVVQEGRCVGRVGICRGVGMLAGMSSVALASNDRRPWHYGLALRR